MLFAVEKSPVILQSACLQRSNEPFAIGRRCIRTQRHDQQGSGIARAAAKAANVQQESAVKQVQEKRHTLPDGTKLEVLQLMPAEVLRNSTH